MGMEKVYSVPPTIVVLALACLATSPVFPWTHYLEFSFTPFSRTLPANLWDIFYPKCGYEIGFICGSEFFIVERAPIGVCNYRYTLVAFG